MTNEQTDLQLRQIEVERLFQRNADELRDLALENPAIMVADADNIIEGVASYLGEYQGQINDDEFKVWAADIIRPAAQRIARLYQLLEEHGGAIRGGIRSALPIRNQMDDNNALTEEIFQEVAILILRYLDRLTKPGPAKLSSRLYGLARRHALDYHVKKARRRHMAVQRRISQSGSFHIPEVMSSQELAAMTAEE